MDTVTVIDLWESVRLRSRGNILVGGSESPGDRRGSWEKSCQQMLGSRELLPKRASGMETSWMELRLG